MLNTLVSHKSTVFKPRLKLMLQSDGSRRSYSNEFQSDPQQQRSDGRMFFLKPRKSKEVPSGRSQMLSPGNIGDWDAVVDEVLRRFILNVPVNRNCQLELHPLRNIEPVQFVMQ